MAKEIQKSKPCAFFIGTVEGINPLRIRKNKKLVLEEEFLVVAKHLNDYKQEITQNGEKRTILIHNALKKGDEVLVLQNQGGQSFAVLEKVGDV